jgi:hypothetical protein
MCRFDTLEWSGVHVCCLISGFYHVDDTSALLICYAALSGNSLLMFQDNNQSHLQG